MGSYISSPQVLSRKVSGNYRVGCKDLMIEGLFMRLYFPTDSEITEISAHALWLPKPEYAHGLGEYLGASQQKMDLISMAIVGDKREDCIDNAQLSTKQDSWPIVIFSHGLGGSRTFYSTYCTSLASHGYIVAAIEHKDHSACWTFNLTEKNGEMVEEALKIQLIKNNDPDEFKLRNQQVEQRVAECVRALKVLEQLNAGVVPEKLLVGKDFDWTQFHNKLMTGSASIIGHSFGGATCLASTAFTKEFQKSIVLDGWMFALDPSQQQNSNQPTMFLNIGDWQWNENLEVMKKILPNNDANLLLTLNGGVHQSFSDFPFIFPNWMAKQFGVQGTTESSLCIQAAIELSIAFLQNGKDGAQKVKNEKYSTFITNEIYGREKFKS